MLKRLRGKVPGVGKYVAKEYAKPFYKSKLWQETRQYILKRDKYRCQECGGIAEEVHHKEWLTSENINDPNIAVNPDNLVSLCYKCHKEKHKKLCNQIVEVNYKFDGNGDIIPPGGDV